MDQEKFDFINQVLDSKIHSMVTNVMNRLKGYGSESKLSADDSGLNNTWEEIADQILNGESIYWEQYQREIERIIGIELIKMDGFYKKILWTKLISFNADEVNEVDIDEKLTDFIKHKILLIAETEKDENFDFNKIVNSNY